MSPDAGDFPGYAHGSHDEVDAARRDRACRHPIVPGGGGLLGKRDAAFSFDGRKTESAV